MLLNIITNPQSGNGTNKKTLDIVQDFLKKKNIPFIIHKTQKKFHAKSIAKTITAQGGKTVVAIGGDGTFSEILNGMDFSTSRLGFIPSGRGNDFASGVHISKDPIKALKAILQGTHKDYDYIQVAQKRCLNVCGTGLDIEVLKAVENSKNTLSYTASLCKCLLKFRPYNICVSVDGGEQKQYQCIMAAVCNGSQYGGGMKICPPAVANDGKLNLVIVQKPKGVPCVVLVPFFVAGLLFARPYYHHIICQKACIISQGAVQLDGEIYSQNTLDAKIIKGGLKSFEPV